MLTCFNETFRKVIDYYESKNTKRVFGSGGSGARLFVFPMQKKIIGRSMIWKVSSGWPHLTESTYSVKSANGVYHPTYRNISYYKEYKILL